MAKLTRVTGKVFGATADSSGNNPEIGQFGSAKAGTYNGTGDVATIQSLTAWSNGWIDAVTPTQQYPALPEMTGVHKVLSYQSTYILQEGVPEYDAATTYYTNSICKGLNANNELVLYKSLIDNNTGNALTDTTKWEELNLGGEWGSITGTLSNQTDLQNALNNKIDKNDCYLIYPVIETYKNGTSYYRIYSDGWCEQGGLSMTGTQINFLKTFADTNYFVWGMLGSDVGTNSGLNVNNSNKTASSVIITKLAGGGAENLYWKAEGYLASGQYTASTIKGVQE